MLFFCNLKLAFDNYTLDQPHSDLIAVWNAHRNQRSNRCDACCDHIAVSDPIAGHCMECTCNYACMLISFFNQTHLVHALQINVDFPQARHDTTLAHVRGFHRPHLHQKNCAEKTPPVKIFPLGRCDNLSSFHACSHHVCCDELWAQVQKLLMQPTTHHKTFREVSGSRS